MQIIIDIPKEMMSYINKNEFNAISEAFYGSMAMLAIKNGTPLPKGHGDIVDIETLCDMFWDGNSMEITKYDLSVIEPIIGADRAESEDRE